MLPVQVANLLLQESGDSNTSHHTVSRNRSTSSNYGKQECYPLQALYRPSKFVCSFMAVQADPFLFGGLIACCFLSLDHRSQLQ